MRNKIFGYFLMAFAIFAFITGCNDDFSEEDLLRLQLQLGNEQDSIKAANALEALNEAGSLVGLQMKIVDTDGNGVEGLSVVMAAASGGSGTLQEQTETTDANGVAVFDSVAIGGNIISVSGGNIIPVTLDADFGSISQGVHYQIIDGVIVPTPVTESAIITVLDQNVSTATVTGNVIIETDLTNEATEVPQDLTVRATFDDGLSQESSFSLDYFFATNFEAQYNLGTGAVDNTTGAYTMTVPAGVVFDIERPDISVTQRIAVASVDGIELDVPEYRDVNTFFGPSYGTSTIPFVRGARIVFDAPVSGGSGFALSGFARVPRDQGYTVGVPTTRLDFGSEVWQFTSLGAGYTGSPTVTITDATGENMYAEAHVGYAVTGLTLSDAGTGYVDGVTYNFDVIYDEIEDDGDGTTTVDEDVVFSFSTLQVTAGPGGIIQDSINAALAEAIADEDFFFDPTSLATIGDNVTNLRLINDDATTDAIITVSSAVGRLTNFLFTGDNFTDPTFTFSDGGGTTQAAVSVDWGSQWTFTLDNTNTVAYNSLPDIFFELDDPDDVVDKVTSSNVEQRDSNGNLVITDDIVDFLTISSGNIAFIDQTSTFRTNSFSISEPVAVVTDPSPGENAEGRVTVNDEGQVTGITVDDTGDGYTSEFGATIEPGADGAPGTGATVQLFEGISNADGTFTWFGNIQITNQGADYLEELNLINNNGGTRGFSDGDETNVFLNAGDTYNFDIDYGTGFRSTEYGGTL